MLKVHKLKLLLIFLSFKQSIGNDLICPFVDDEICQKAIAENVTPCNEINGSHINDSCNKYEICLEALKLWQIIGHYEFSEGQFADVTCSEICKHKSYSPDMGQGGNWPGDIDFVDEGIDENGYCIFE
jgi:hypothetical protein